MHLSPLETKIYKIAAPVAQDLELRLVTIKITGEGSSLNVQVMAEDANGVLGVDDCAKLSRALSATLDVEDLINGAYRLEVSSPGIDRQLVREEDFATYAGFEVKLETNTTNERGQKKFRGILKGIDDAGNLTIETDQGSEEIAFGIVKKAKLILTDDLIKRTSSK